MERNLWKCRVFAAALAALLLSGQGAFAQDKKSDETVSLDDIVVSATKTERKVEDAPGSVTVVTKDDLERQKVTTVDQAIRTVVGVFDKRTKGIADSTPTIRMRGYSGDEYVLVLIDGQPANDAYTGGLEWGAIPVENIERIEVLRGAASSLHGGNAVGGVINIITKTPKKFEATASAGYGTNETVKYSASAGGRFFDRFAIRFAYEKEESDGYVSTPVVRTISTSKTAGNVKGGYLMNDKYGLPTRWVVGDNGENGGARESVNGKLVFDYSDTGKLTFSAINGRDEYYYGVPHSLMGSFGDTTTYAFVETGKRSRFQPNDFITGGIGSNETQMYSLGWKDMFGIVGVRALSGLMYVDERYTSETGSGLQFYYDSPGSLKITENESWFTELGADIPLGDSHVLTFGGTYRTDESETNEYAVPYYRSYAGYNTLSYKAGGESVTWGAYIQDEWKIIAPLTLYTGVRYDFWDVSNGHSGAPATQTTHEDHSESAVSPKVALVWKAFENTTFRTSVGHAFRAPTLYELYRDWKSSTGMSYGNPELKPENAWSYEIGAEQWLFSKRTRLSLTVYQNNTEDLIYSKAIGNDTKRVNAGEARTVGVEAEVSQKVFDWLTLWGNYTYTDAKILENEADPASVGKRVWVIPMVTYNAGADFAWKWLTANVTYRYYADTDDPLYIDGVYGTYEPAAYLDAKVTVKPFKWMDLSVAAENILDEKYYEYYLCDGVTYFGSVTIRY